MDTIYKGITSVLSNKTTFFIHRCSPNILAGLSYRITVSLDVYLEIKKYVNDYTEDDGLRDELMSYLHYMVGGEKRHKIPIEFQVSEDIETTYLWTIPVVDKRKVAMITFDLYQSILN